MTDLPAEPLGAAWLAHAYGVRPLGRPPVTSQVGGRRATRVDEGFRLETYTEAMRPAADPAAPGSRPSPLGSMPAGRHSCMSG